MKAMHQTIEQWFYPEMKSIAPQHRGRALRYAREQPLDLIELGGMALVIVGVTALTRYSLVETSVMTRAAAGLVNFLVALPLLIVGLGPFHVRRVRRGLAEYTKSPK